MPTFVCVGTSVNVLVKELKVSDVNRRKKVCNSRLARQTQTLRCVDCEANLKELGWYDDEDPVEWNSSLLAELHRNCIPDNQEAEIYAKKVASKFTNNSNDIAALDLIKTTNPKIIKVARRNGPSGATGET